MIPRVRRVSVAVAAMLTIGSVCLADEPNYGSGRGGIGGLIGASTFRLDRGLGNSWFGDYSLGAKARFSFTGNFRYVFTRHFRLQFSPGFTWSGYYEDTPPPLTDPRFPNDTNKGAYLTELIPMSFQGQLVMRKGWWVYHVGAGPGLYRVWITNHREVLKDPVTFKHHRGLFPGGSAEIGAERFLKGLPSTSVEASFAGHLVRAEKDDDFVSGINSNLGVLDLRIGANYYFSPGVSKKKSETK